LKIFVHDFGGYGFIFDLGRALAALGHEVEHAYLQDLPGPKADATVASGNSAYRVVPVSLGRKFRKYSMLRRLRDHRSYALQLIKRIEQFRPDVVLSANSPIDVEARVLSACRRLNIPFVHWMQDLYYLAIRHVLSRRSALAGKWLAAPFKSMQKWVCENADGIIVISEDFIAESKALGINIPDATVLHNWAPLTESRPSADLMWRARLSRRGEPVFLYAGILGLKHRPDLILELCRAVHGKASVAVFSEGVGRDYLEEQRQTGKFDNLTLWDFQDHAVVPAMLSAGDVLVALLDSECGSFAVPSKILMYLASGRSILMAAPSDNLAARTVRSAGAGFSVPPSDSAVFGDAAQQMATDAVLRQAMAENARSYAEKHFRIQEIAAKFESVLLSSCRDGRLVAGEDTSAYALGAGSRK
jgi:colanic acid biosynthesis glycosyl transferase WcaI